MEKFSGINRKVRLPVTVSIPACFRDHRFGNNAVLPAVEAVRILGSSTLSYLPDLCLREMTEASFPRFLVIGDEQKELEAFNDITILENGSVCSTLVTKIRAGKSEITRYKEHATVVFGNPDPSDEKPPMDAVSALEGVCIRIPPEDIYRYCVPFGASYRNIIDMLYVSNHGALANVRAGTERETPGFGSPFPMDAAFHAACVWGQAATGIVAFPTAVFRWTFPRPTAFGETYTAVVIPTSVDSSGFLFDIHLFDKLGNLRESAFGIEMKDVSRGRMKAPEWLKKNRPPFLENISSCVTEHSLIEIDTLQPYAETVLTQRENQRAQKMGDKRKKSYLSARICLKRLSRRLSGNDEKVSPQMIETVLPDNVRPCCRMTDGKIRHNCSVSHDSRFAVAVVSEHRVGIDVEKIAERVLRSRKYYMNESETALAEQSSLGPVPACIRVWTIKEAVSKAFDVPLTSVWKRTEVVEIGEEKSWIRFDGQTFFAVHDQIGDHLFTLVEIEKKG